MEGGIYSRVQVFNTLCPNGRARVWEGAVGPATWEFGISGNIFTYWRGGFTPFAGLGRARVRDVQARASRQVFLVARVPNYHIPKYIHIFAQRFYTFRGIGRARVRDVHARGYRQVCRVGRVRNLHMQEIYSHIYPADS